MYNVYGDKMKIYLIRHGETEANKQAIIQGRTDNPLNQTGIDQAIQTGRYLKIMNVDFDYCVSSPLNRAIHTIELIKNELNLNLHTHIEKDLIERDFGEYDGVKIGDGYYEAVHGNIIPGLETDKEIEKRVSQFFLSFFKKNNYKHVLMVAHAHVIKALLVQNLNDFDYDTYLKNCSINIIGFDDKIEVIDYNIDPLD